MLAIKMHHIKFETSKKPRSEQTANKTKQNKASIQQQQQWIDVNKWGKKRYEEEETNGKCSYVKLTITQI